MELYLISAEELEKHRIDKGTLERVFDYVTFEDIREEFQNRGDEITDKRLEVCCDLLLTKYDSSNIEDIMSFFEVKGVVRG